jgi:hypothetical protein
VADGGNDGGRWWAERAAVNCALFLVFFFEQWWVQHTKEKRKSSGCQWAEESALPCALFMFQLPPSSSAFVKCCINRRNVEPVALWKVGNFYFNKTEFWT